MFIESCGHAPDAGRRGAASRGLVDGVCGAPRSYGRDVLVLILARGSLLLEERGGVRGKERRAQGRARRMGAGYACRAGYEADGEELQRYGGSAKRF